MATPPVTREEYQKLFPQFVEMFPEGNYGPSEAPGVPRQTTNPNQSGTGTSPGNGGTATQPFGANVAPSIKKNFELKEKLLRPALTSHYQCWFNPPEPVLDWLVQKGLNYPSNAELISLSCTEASLPGSSFMTNEITDDHTGVTERHAYRRAYDDRVDFTFYVDHGRQDGNYNILWFFEKWMQYIANEQDALGLDKREFNYRVRFPEQYQTDNLFINKFERDFAGQYLQYKFMQAYPISLNSIPVSYDSSQLLKVTVSFTYTRYLTTRSNNQVTENDFERALSAGVAAGVGAALGSAMAQELLDINKSSGGAIQVKNPIPVSTLQKQIRDRRLGL